MYRNLKLLIRVWFGILGLGALIAAFPATAHAAAIAVTNYNFAAPVEASGVIGAKTAITGWTAESVPSGKICGVWNPTTTSFARDGSGYLAGAGDSATQCLWVGPSGYSSEVYQRPGGAINIAANTYYTMVVACGTPLDKAYLDYGIELWAISGASQITLASNWDGKADGTQQSPTGNSTPLTSGSGTWTDETVEFNTLPGSTGKGGMAIGTKYNGKNLAIQVSGEACAYTNVRLYSSTTGYYVPEPGTGLLLGMGAISGLLVCAWRRRKSAN